MFMKQYARIACSIAVALLTGAHAASAAETMADYTDNPIFLSNSVIPNILIIQDNSGSMNDLAYSGSTSGPSTTYDSATSYYGYFNPSYTYDYASNVFSINTAGTGQWNGNFLNWAAMRRVDVARKVLMGGLATSRTGGGNQQNIGDSGSGWWVWKFGPADTTGLSPYHNDATYQYTYELNAGYLYIYKYKPSTGSWTYVTRYNVVVQKDSTLEPTEFVSGNLSGIMQKVETKARWGLEFFNDGCGNGEGCNPARDGGNVTEPIVGTGYGTNMITTIQNTAANTWTPLAESLYTGVGYYAQSTAMKYASGNYSTGVQGKDPFYYSDYSQLVSCGKNFVILITDGDPTMDSYLPVAGIVPSNIKDYDGDGEDPTPTSGGSYTSDYLDDVALWAHTSDLRSDITGTQTITLYTVWAFGSGTAAPTLLKNASKNGAFIDSNSNKLPDVTSEWDADGDGIPDTYYEANDGAALETQLMAAITDILKRASSGTAVSVLATSATGAGNVFQAYFLPSKSVIDATGAREVNWIGHLLSLNIDSSGSLRDKNNNCIAFSFDSGANETVINTLAQNADGTCGATVTGTTPLTDFTAYNWNAGDKLAAKTATSRIIYAFVDADKNGLDNGSELIAFTDSNAATLQTHLGASTLTEAQNIIKWVRGESITGYRDRTIDSNQWKLGDIIHSTPTVVGAPAENYGTLYGDASYNSYYNTQKNRASTIYLGANDGMLHAFSASTGEEQWAFIPYNLIPHLRWMKDTSYTHVNYVDLKLKATDIKGTAAHPGEWRTIIIGGMRFGGGEISDSGFDIDADGDSPASKLRYRRSAFFAIDVTNPAAPEFMWEVGHNMAAYGLTDNALGFSMTYPAIAKVGDSFFAIVGSGAKSSYVPGYQGETFQQGRVFVINVSSGSIAATFSVPDTLSWFADPITVDIDFVNTNTVIGGSGGLSYNTDAIYIGETYWKSTGGGSWNSRMWRIVTDPSPGGASPGNDTNPANWRMYHYYDMAAGQSITAAAATTTDKNKNLWVFFGTGKYYSTADKTDTSTQAMYGVKDPCWDGPTAKWLSQGAATSNNASISCNWGSANSAGSPSPSVALASMLNVTSAAVTTSGTVSGVTGATTFTDLQTLITTKLGWYMNFTLSKERSLNKPSVIGGLVLFTSFIPDTSVCGLGGNSYFYAAYYETGTAYYQSVIGTSGSTVLRRSATSSVGMASSIAIHAGREQGMKAFVQMSTGEATSISLTTPPGDFSGIIAWREL